MSRLQATVFQVLEGFTLSDDVRKILEAAYYADDSFTQGRAAGLEEAANLVMDFPFKKTLGELLYWSDDCKAMALCASNAIRALSPIPSDAGKDDARDAARYRYLRDAGSNLFKTNFLIYCDYKMSEIDSAIDAALSSLEVIGKGEKG